MNFGALPTSKFTGKGNFEPAKPGVYLGHISKTEMRTSQNTGAEYLSVTIDISDKNDKKKGKVFDMFFDSDKSFVLYKLRRFIEACGIPCEGEMTLKDLAKLVQDQNLVVWTQEDEYNGKKRLVPNLRDAEGYYPYDQFTEVYNIWAAVNSEQPIDVNADFVNVPDGVDEELPFGSDSEDEF